MEPAAAIAAIEYLKIRNAVLEQDVALYQKLLDEAAANYQKQAQEIARLKAQLNIERDN